MLAYAFLIALSAPLVLIPVEKFLPYPYIIEEAVKLTIVLLILKEEQLAKKSYFLFAVLFALTFAISESILYLINFFLLQDFSLFYYRLIYTSMLHVVTLIAMYLLSKKGRYMFIPGYLTGVLLHFIYNYIVGELIFL